MGKQREIHRARKKALKELESVFEAADHTVLIHYSCESFYNRTDPRSPRVTSIAVRNLSSGQTRSFSIHLVAERRNWLANIESHYDKLEREMLESFFDHVRERQHCTWLHWNMRDANYGFEALENRIRALGSAPAAQVPENKRVDLSRMLINIYGVAYIDHPRLESLMRANDITPLDFMAGPQEAQAFEEKEFVKLHQSTLRKVDVLANIAGRAHRDELRTRATWWQLHGSSIKAVGEWLREHWLIGAIVAVLGVVSEVVDLWPRLSAFFER